MGDNIVCLQQEEIYKKRIKKNKGWKVTTHFGHDKKCLKEK